MFQLKSIAVAFLLVSPLVCLAEVKLPALFGNNMVLSKADKVPVFGTADAGQTVAVYLNNQTAQATADADGHWRVDLDLSKESDQPTKLVIHGNEWIVYDNVLIGQVWLCSGQSNMEFSVNGAKDVAAEKSAANYSTIRHFAVKKLIKDAPTTELQGRWEVCTPQTVGGFTAVGYFFARELMTGTKQPVGLIHSSWGGTPAEAWISTPALEAQPSLKPMAEAAARSMKDPEPAAQFAERIKKWEHEHMHQDPGNRGVEQGWANADFNDTQWKTMELPTFWQAKGLDFNGAVWFRKTIELGEDARGKDLSLELGGIDDFDTTYFNGVKVGATADETPRYWEAQRKYKLPAAQVKVGKNVIAIRVFDHGGQGGVCGPDAAAMKLAGIDKPIALAGDWRYSVELQLPNLPANTWASAPQPSGGVNQNTATVLFNGMINPLLPYAINGALWYQGESNVGRADQYRVLLPAMIHDWRSRWGINFPFYIVQLANYQARKPQPGNSGWAELRDAQTKIAQSVENCGLATIIDIGEGADIHPKNKQDVGKRLALIALNKIFHQDVEYSGPVYDSMSVEAISTIRVKFTHADGLVAKGDKLVGFAIAGINGKFAWADAKIDGDSVILSSPEVATPTAVRYAWADNPECNLYNKADLPAVPFRTDGK